MQDNAHWETIYSTKAPDSGRFRQTARPMSARSCVRSSQVTTSSWPRSAAMAQRSAVVCLSHATRRTNCTPNLERHHHAGPRGASASHTLQHRPTIHLPHVPKANGLLACINDAQASWRGRGDAPPSHRPRDQTTAHRTTCARHQPRLGWPLRNSPDHHHQWRGTGC